MLSEGMLKKYEEAYDKFSELFSGSDFIVRHRSFDNYEKNENRDLSFFHQDEWICGVYVAKDSYKIYMKNMIWYTHTARATTEKDKNGCYTIRCYNLPDCLDEVKTYAEKVYGYNKK